MTYPAGFNMPGAFYSDGTGVAVSQPPAYHHSPSGEYNEKSPPSSTPKRKRVRGSEGLFGGAKPRTPTRSYTLAGNLDTPAGGDLGPDSDVLEDSLYSESNYRTSFGSKRSRNDDDEGGVGVGPTPLFQVPAEPGSPSNGWGTMAIGVVGGVVGKVWEFCKAGAFKGFYAGGGQAYAMGADGLVAPDHAPTNHGDEYTYGFDHYRYEDYEQRVPGRFPYAQNEERGRTQESQRFTESRTTTPVPAAKRRQTAPANELQGNWVIVKDSSTASPAPLSSTPRKLSGSYRSSPRNRNHGPSVTTGRRINTPGSRRNSVNTPTSNNFYNFDPEENHNRPSSSASFASPRSSSPTKSFMAAASHQHSYSPSYSSSATTVNVGSTASAASPSASHGGRTTATHRRRGSHMSATSSHRRTQSTASAASSRGEEADVDASPRLDAEAKNLAARRKLEERDADVRISAFNKRLQDMIRQGREALGTTIEIDEGGEADAWEDEN